MTSTRAPPVESITPETLSPCPLCHGTAEWLDVVDFNKSCEEAQGKFLPLSGVPIYYALCTDCGFCFAPQICAWPAETFERWIYNADYADVDPDYLGTRPRNNAGALTKAFPQSPGVRHLDYGGGDGLLARLLRERGWDSSSYDPLLERNQDPESPGRFEFITAFEVFEHVPDLNALMRDLQRLRAPNGIVLFSTQITDGQLRARQRIGWWYASPRNGHISLFSRKSLVVLAQHLSLNFASFSSGLHCFFGAVPSWAQHVIKV